MRQYVCDRCGSVIPDGTLYQIRSQDYQDYHRLRFWFSRNQKERLTEVSHDICKNCQEELWKWWDEGKTK